MAPLFNSFMHSDKTRAVIRISISPSKETLISNYAKINSKVRITIPSYKFKRGIILMHLKHAKRQNISVLAFAGVTRETRST